MVDFQGSRRHNAVMDADPAIRDALIPAALLERVEALAATQHRAARDVVRDALEGYIRDWPGDEAPIEPKPTPAEAVKRMLELRKGNMLPPGMTIRDMIDYGRK